MLLHEPTGTPSDLRRRNRFATLSLLREHGPLSKRELANLTNRTMTTVSTILDELIDEGLVHQSAEEIRPENGQRGRPAAQYRLDDDSWYSIGIQITSTTIVGTVVGLNGVVVAEHAELAPADWSSHAVLDLAANIVEDLFARTGQHRMKPFGIGVVTEGLVDPVRGYSLSMPFRHGWNEVPIAQFFEERFNLPVKTDWRVYAATLAEALYGSARGVSDFAYLNVDTGVSGALVASNMLVRSGFPAGITGDFSHVLTTGGPRLCYCGRTGCIQTELTTWALLTQLKELIQANISNGIGAFWRTRTPTLTSMIDAAQQGDVLVLGLRSRFARHLEIAVSSAVQLMSANMVIIGGQSIALAGDEAVEAAQRAIQQLARLHPAYSNTSVVVSTLNPDSATIGAAALITQSVFNGDIVLADTANK